MLTASRAPDDQDCPTRRGSILSMLERVSEQQAAIAAVLIEASYARRSRMESH